METCSLSPEVGECPGACRGVGGVERASIRPWEPRAFRQARGHSSFGTVHFLPQNPQSTHPRASAAAPSLYHSLHTRIGKTQTDLSKISHADGRQIDACHPRTLKPKAGGPEFKTSLDYIVELCQETKTNKPRKTNKHSLASRTIPSLLLGTSGGLS